MANGWDMIINALNNYAAQTGWNERNRLTPVDWGATFQKIFSRKRPESGTPVTGETRLAPVMNPVLGDPKEYSMAMNPVMGRGQTTQRQVQPETPPVIEQTEPQYSPDNPYASMKPKGNTFFVYKDTPERLAAANEWEQQQQDREIARQLQLAQLEAMTRKGEIDPLDRELKRSQIYRNYQTGITNRKEPSLTEKLNKEYADYLKANPVKYDYDGKKIFTPLSKERWIASKYGEQIARQYNVEVSGNPELMERPTTASKTGTAKYVPSDKYTARDWYQVDRDIQNAVNSKGEKGSLRGAIQNVINRMKNGEKIPRGYLEALAARAFPNDPNAYAKLQQKYGENTAVASK